MVTDDNIISDPKDKKGGKKNESAEQQETLSDSAAEDQSSENSSQDKEDSKKSAKEESKQKSASSTEDVIKSLEEKLKKAEEKATSNWDEVLRGKAELDNTRKRLDRDVQNAHKYAVEKFVQELLPVIDSLEMGLVAASEKDVDVSKLKEGTELTLKMFADCIKKMGMQYLDPKEEKFDPEFHQAMSIQESADHEPDTVIAVMQKGYLLNDRLVRPAMVVVSKAASKSADNDAANDKNNANNDEKPQ